MYKEAAKSNPISQGNGVINIDPTLDRMNGKSLEFDLNTCLVSFEKQLFGGPTSLQAHQWSIFFGELPSPDSCAKFIYLGC